MKRAQRNLLAKSVSGGQDYLPVESVDCADYMVNFCAWEDSLLIRRRGAFSRYRRTRTCVVLLENGRRSTYCLSEFS
jgi:hypothetical protein